MAIICCREWDRDIGERGRVQINNSFQSHNIIPKSPVFNYHKGWARDR